MTTTNPLAHLKKLPVLLVLGALFLLPNTSCLAEQANSPTNTTYYVSSSVGSDQADGRTPQTAWRTLDRVNSASLKPGDRVLFQRENLWRGQLLPQSGADGKPVTYGAYGTGAKPILQGSVARDAANDWGQSEKNIWSTLPPTFREGAVRADLSGIKWKLHTEAGAAADFTGSDGAPTDYQLVCRQPGTRQNHIQLVIAPLAVNASERLAFHFRARSSQPVTWVQAAVIKATAPYTPYGHDIGAAPHIGTEWQDFTVYLQIDRTADDARINFSLGTALPAGLELWLQPGKICAALGSPEPLLDADVGNIIFDHGKICGVKKWQREDLHRNGDYFYDQAERKVWLYSDVHPTTQNHSIELALKKHIIEESGRHNVTYEDLQLRYGAAHGIGGGNTSYINVRRCDIYFIGGGHQLTRPDGNPVRYGNGVEFWNAGKHNLVEYCRLWEIYDAALTDQGNGSDSEQVDIAYRHNIIWNSEYSLEYWNRPEKAKTENILFEHNTCVDAGYGWGHNQRPDKNGRHLMFYSNVAATRGVIVRNNIFCNATDSCLRMDNDWRDGLTLDRNLWFQKTGTFFTFLRRNFTADQLEAYRIASGFDLHSVIADPNFCNAAQCDYRLASGSPGLKWTTEGQPCGANPIAGNGK